MKSRAWILYVCFFVSGIAGLIYEVLWSRYLALFVGGTGQAHVIILSTYMGGLALGAWLFGKMVDRTPSPLRLYVYLELGIGLLGLIYPKLFTPVRGIFLTIVGALGMNPVTLNIAAIVACVLTILVPTTLMGGTLPVLGRYMIRNQQSIGRAISNLYYLNSFGAVVGSLLAGFWLIRTVGLEMSMIIAAILNFMVALMARILVQIDDSEGIASRRLDIEDRIEEWEETAEAAPVNPPVRIRGLASPVNIALVVIAVSGFASMIYEVAWIRLLALVLGSTTYSFSLMLAAFISGITIGSFLLSFKRSEEGYFRILGWCELGIGLTALLSIMVYQRLPLMVNQWRTSLVPIPETFGLYQFGMFAMCFTIMVVPTIFMGATVPAASRVAAEGLRTLGRKIGNVFSINTIGTLLGASVAGFILLPTIGIRHTVEFAVAINITLGLWVLFSANRQESGAGAVARSMGAVVLSVAVVAIYFIFAPEWDRRNLTSATYRIAKRIPSFKRFKELVQHREILYYKDGTDATVAVVTDLLPPGDRRTKALQINGKTDASNGADMITQLLIGHIPMMLHPNPQEVLVVGMGSGVTAGATTLYNAKHVDCVELIPEVCEAARFFKEYNNDVVDSGKAQITIQDAKTFLQVTPRQYDVIINEPTNLWVTGVAGLFTREYFEICQQKLRPGGMFLQWLQAYEILDSTMLSMLNTFNQAFPFSTLIAFDYNDIAFIGSNEPFAPDFARVESHFQNPRIAKDLGAFGIDGVLPLLAMQLVAKNLSSGPYVTIGGTNSDFFPSLEHEAAMGFFLASKASTLKMIDRRGWAPGRSGLWIEQYKPPVKPPETLFIHYFERLRVTGSLFDSIEEAWCDLWAQHYPDSQQLLLARARINKGGQLEQLGELENPALATSDTVLAMRASMGVEEYERRRSFVNLPDQSKLRPMLERMLSIQGAGSKTYMSLGDFERDALHPDKAVEFYKQGLDYLKTVEPKFLASEVAADEFLLRIADAYLDMKLLAAAREVLSGMNEDLISTSTSLRKHILECRAFQIELTMRKVAQTK